MKRVLVITLLIMMLFSFTNAEEKEVFDHTKIENFEGYNYDKFDKRWYFFDVYEAKKTVLETVYIGLQIEDVDGLLVPSFYINAIGRDENAAFEIVGADVLIDDAVFSYENPYHTENGITFMFIGYTVNEMISTMASVKKEISVRIRKKNGTNESFDLDMNTFSATIGRIAKKVVDEGAMDCAMNDQVLLYWESEHKPSVH